MWVVRLDLSAYVCALKNFLSVLVPACEYKYVANAELQRCAKLEGSPCYDVLGFVPRQDLVVWCKVEALRGVGSVYDYRNSLVLQRAGIDVHSVLWGEVAQCAVLRGGGRLAPLQQAAREVEVLPLPV